MKNLKKILFSVLALTLVTGCTISIDEGDKDTATGKDNIPNSESKVKDEDYVLANMTYLKTDEKEVTLNGKKHELKFIYSYGLKRYEGNQWFNTVYLTVLMDEKIIDDDLVNMNIYKDFYSDEDEERYHISTAHKMSKSDVLETINKYSNKVSVISNSKNQQYIVYGQQSFENANTYYKLFIVNDEKRILYRNTIVANYLVADSNNNYVTPLTNNLTTLSTYVTIDNSSVKIWGEDYQITVTVSSDGEVVNEKAGKSYKNLNYTVEHIGM